MTIDNRDLELAHAFARAYREIDEGTMKNVAPAARIRILMPRGFFEHEGPDHSSASCVRALHRRDAGDALMGLTADHVGSFRAVRLA